MKETGKYLINYGLCVLVIEDISAIKVLKANFMTVFDIFSTDLTIAFKKSQFFLIHLQYLLFYKFLVALRGEIQRQLGLTVFHEAKFDAFSVLFSLKIHLL